MAVILAKQAAAQAGEENADSAPSTKSCMRVDDISLACPSFLDIHWSFLLIVRDMELSVPISAGLLVGYHRWLLGCSGPAAKVHRQI